MLFQESSQSPDVLSVWIFLFSDDKELGFKLLKFHTIFWLFHKAISLCSKYTFLKCMGSHYGSWHGSLTLENFLLFKHLIYFNRGKFWPNEIWQHSILTPEVLWSSESSDSIAFISEAET